MLVQSSHRSASALLGIYKVCLSRWEKRNGHLCHFRSSSAQLASCHLSRLPTSAMSALSETCKEASGTRKVERSVSRNGQEGGLSLTPGCVSPILICA